MIDKPLYENPLAGGSGQLGGATFRQEGDMGRYVAFNDPGQPGAGFSNLEDYLAAGNKLPEQKTLNDLLGVSNANFNVSPPGTLKLDPIMQGFQDSEFRKNANMMQQDAVYFKYKGEDRMMNSSMAGAFKQYLDSIGKGNLYEPEVQLSGPLQKVGIDDQLNPLNPVPGYQQATPPILDATRSVSPIVTGPETFEIATQQAPMDPYNRVGQQLTGPNQDDILGTLKNIEQGIASLGGNFGQNFNMNQSSNYGDFDNFGIGSFFPPYGGMYG